MALAAQDLDLTAIAIFTESGYSGRLLSKYRPETPIYVLSPDQAVINRSMLLWGTTPVLCARFHDTDVLVSMADDILRDAGYVQDRQILGIVAGTRTKSGGTNFMRLHMVGDQESTLSLKKKEKVKDKKAKAKDKSKGKSKSKKK
jgi:pyruvate kinase